MDKGYRVLKLKELVEKLGLPSSKSFKTTDYLTYVIEAIEDAGLRFIQVLQLVDVLYVIVQEVRQEEYNPGRYNFPVKKTTRSKIEPDVKDDYKIESPTAAPVSKKMEVPVELEKVKQRDLLNKEMTKQKLPWQK